MTKQEKAAALSIATNVLLTLAKFVLASVTASVALLAEAYHSFADIFSSTMVLVAIRADRRDASESATAQPTGGEDVTVAKPRRRLFAASNWENKVAMGIGILLIVVALAIFRKVSQPSPIFVRYPLAAAIAVSFLAACSYLLYRFEISVGQQTNSTALIADGHHAHTDMLASVFVAITLVATQLRAGVDRIAACVIGLFIFTKAVYVLTQALRAYAAAAKGQGFSRETVYEDSLFFLVNNVFSGFGNVLWQRLRRIPGLRGPHEVAKRRFGLALVGLGVLLAVCSYTLSGFYVLRPWERAIVARFGKPLRRRSPAAPGLHYHWPWPIERVKRADVEGIRRLTIGYTAGERKDLILWTNIHYLREYSIITGEGPFLDVAMNVHYRIDDLYRYLYGNADPDTTVEKIGYQLLRETLGTRPFFSPITTERDSVEALILAEMQKRVDEQRLGVLIQSICFRDVHPPTEVAPAFEDVISAQEDYEAYIEEAYGYRKDLLPRARATADTALNDAKAYRNVLIAQSTGSAKSFSAREKAYRKAKDLTHTRMLLETVEQTLPGIPKYIVATSEGHDKPDLWLHTPLLNGTVSAGSDLRETELNQARDETELRVSPDEDLVGALLRFQEGRIGERE